MSWLNKQLPRVISLTLDIIKRYWVFVLLFFIYILVKVFKIEIVPDYLSMYRVNLKDYFTIIISTTAAIFGIIIAVVLLAFQILELQTSRHQKENILDKNRVINFISIGTFIIIFSLISYVDTDSLTSSNDLSVAYLIGFVFILFILFIIPVSRGILEETNILKKTLREIEELTIDDCKNIYPKFNEAINESNENLLFEKLKQRMINYVRDGDHQAYNKILDRLNNKIIELISDGQDREMMDILLKSLTFVWNGSVFESLRVGNQQYFESIWKSIARLYKTAANRHIYLLHFQEIDFYIYSFLKLLSSNKQIDALSVGVKVLIESLKQNLHHNCPPQEKLNELYRIFEKEKEVEHYVDESIQWDQICDFLWDIQKIQISAIELKSKELYDVCRWESELLTRDLNYNEFPNVGIYQEAVILITIFSNQTYLAFEANEGSIYKDTSGSFKVQNHLISDLVVKQRFYVKRILPDISDFLIKSQKKGRLNDFDTINSWCAIGRQVSKEYCTNEIAKKVIDYIVETFNYLKKYIEVNQLPREARNYNEIKKQLISLKECLEKDNAGKEIVILSKLTQIIEDFKEVQEEPDFNILKWESE